MTEPVVAAHAVSRRYASKAGTVGGVVDVTLALGAGEIVGVRGPSGAGKSTLLRLLAGIDRPDDGELAYRGEPAWPAASRRSRRRSAAYPRPGYVMPVYQDPAASLDARWPIWRTMTEPLTVHGPPRPSRAERRAHARRLLDRSGMAHVDETARPGELSGGQCQRIAILRSTIAGPALIVADEPTARQDVITAAAMTQQLRGAAESGVAIVVVSHNAAWLDTLAHRVVELRDGRVVTP